MVALSPGTLYNSLTDFNFKEGTGMASKEMEMLKVGMKMMMAQGFAPKFDGSIDPIHLRHIVQAAQERMAAHISVLLQP